MSTATPDIAASPEAAAAQLLNQAATGYMVSAALQAALKLEIADRLTGGPRPVSELAREAGVTEDGLYRVLRALASVGIFEEQAGTAGTASRIFALNLAGRMLCKGPRSMRDMGLFIGEFWYLEDLAADCAADGVYECMLVAPALRFTRGCGSPVNPIALK